LFTASLLFQHTLKTLEKGNMRKGNKKPKKSKPKIQNYDNPFDDIFFWLNLASTDFTFGLFEENKEPEPNKKNKWRRKQKTESSAAQSFA
jgi:hypothetical protein